MKSPWALLVAAVVVLASSPNASFGCPFCAAVKNTLSEEIESVDAAVIGKLQSTCKPSPDDKGGLKARFEVVEIIKGEKLVGGAKFIETVYFGEAAAGSLFLIAGVDPTNLQWATPQKLGEQGREYLHNVLSLPKSGKERLTFFLKYLESDDSLLAIDAYDEFARAPYADVVALKDVFSHEKVLAWIKNENVPANRRRLYVTMLGICGKSEDVAMLEEMLKSTDRKYRQGLDAIIACYINLKGAEALPLIDELFLKNKAGEFADTHAALMALRFHIMETKVLARERVLDSFHLILERPALADLVIPDLARMEDWSVVARLTKLFKDADDKNNWVRVPVINYLRVCPLPEAKTALVELEKIDPQAVKRANTFFPVTPSGAAKPEPAVTPKSSELRLRRMEEQSLVSSGSLPLPPPDVEEQTKPAASASASIPQSTALAATANSPVAAGAAEFHPASKPSTTDLAANPWYGSRVVTCAAFLAAALVWAARPALRRTRSIGAVE